jgi:hypothetical protein
MPRALTTLRERLTNVGAKAARRGRSIAFQMAAVALPKEGIRRDPAACRATAATA